MVGSQVQIETETDPTLDVHRGGLIGVQSRVPLRTEEDFSPVGDRKHPRRLEKKLKRHTAHAVPVRPEITQRNAHV